ncbi:DEAD/DEAH box helicase [uncultured Veillonella sp.]|uniref:DEAD/DEAH box helicase n=1 Tax=uncultured Veillonella sp. TaxID=159268 RepID=UPI00262EDC82|nr:DEAD/DEAH box helicase [uncultured Veillonella sp.]
MSESNHLINFATSSELIANGEGRNVLSAIEDGLRNCDEFLISVAFITPEGLLTLKPILKELEDRGVYGRVLTTDYLGFNSPQVLEDLGNLNNIELKVYCTTQGSDHGFHTKGYIFRKDESYQIIVGSSNLTINALKKNREWNTRSEAHCSDTYAREITEEFDLYWNSKFSIPYEDFIPWYKPRWVRPERTSQRTVAEQFRKVDLLKLEPNSMQQQFIANFNELRANNAKRGLLISATGTGKTYAAAFAMREMRPKRILFLVHREQIAKQAIASFERIYNDPSITFGLVSGNAKYYNATHVFSTMQMMGRNDVMKQYAPKEFDCIIIDEVHRAGSDSYQRIIEYFEPQFLLGMTASPERTDGYDLYELFDHNIIYEIRLQQALEEDLLCPFHYFGISDLWVDTQEDISDMEVSFSNLSTKERVDKIIEKIRYFGHSGSRVKGLVFCSNRVEAKALSDAFNERGVYRTVCLTGEDSQETREIAIARLTGTGDYQGRSDLQLDYIFTVDIFNEGVDIPEINQVIMLRQTESPIIFIQQLGRGLRKFEDKEYVVILDFIGNYTNNFMIPLALSGDRSYNKDTLRRYVQAGNRIIPGTSTVHFDKIAKQRIYESIDTARFSDMKLIKEAYFNLRFKLGRIPKISDFADHGSIDVSRIFSKFKSYHHFLIKIKDKDYDISFTPVQERMLHFISQKLTTGIRAHELLVLQALLDGHDDVINYVSYELDSKYNVKLSENGRINLINIMTNQFGVKVAQKTFADSVFIELSNGRYGISQAFKEALEDSNFKEQVQELVIYGLRKYKEKYQHNIYYKTPFVLYEKYNFEQVCQLLEWPKNAVAQNIGGYQFNVETNTYPVFINYHKDEMIQDSIKYEDEFLSPILLKAISKARRYLTSPDVDTILRSNELGIAMHLFVRKNKDDEESKEFYYLGPIYSTGIENAKEITMAGGTKAVELEYVLEVPVRDDIYDYIVNG